MKPINGQTVERALRKTAQLRALTLSLKRAKDRPAWEQQLAQFAAFRRALESQAGKTEPLTLPPADVLFTGVQACRARKDMATLRRAASAVLEDLLAQYPLLRAYLVLPLCLARKSGCPL
jgi:hypothetical protein